MIIDTGMRTWRERLLPTIEDVEAELDHQIEDRDRYDEIACNLMGNVIGDLKKQGFTVLTCGASKGVQSFETDRDRLAFFKALKLALLTADREVFQVCSDDRDWDKEPNTPKAKEHLCFHGNAEFFARYNKIFMRSLSPKCKTEYLLADYTPETWKIISVAFGLPTN